MAEITEQHLQELCAKWQKRLGLSDWTVKASLVRQYEMGDEQAVGHCNWVLSKRSASIKVLDPIDYPPDIITPYNPETTLVHELIHLHFAPFMADHDTLEHILQEQAIDAIAKALVPEGGDPVGPSITASVDAAEAQG